MLKESEASPFMMLMIDTGKHAALCAKLNIPVDAPADVMLDTVMANLSLLDIYHRGIGWIEAQRFKLEAKAKNMVK